MIVLARNWWLFVLRGIAALVFGLAAILWPGSTLLVLVALFGAFALVNGVLAVAAAVRRAAAERPWGTLLLEGAVGIVIAAVTFFWPAITALALVYLIALWAVVTGAFQVVAAVRLREEISGEWLLALGGLVSIVFGVLLAIYPAAGGIALVWLIGGYALVFGVVLIALGLRLRTFKKAAVRVGERPPSEERRGA